MWGAYTVALAVAVVLLLLECADASGAAQAQQLLNEELHALVDETDGMSSSSAVLSGYLLREWERLSLARRAYTRGLLPTRPLHGALPHEREWERVGFQQERVAFEPRWRAGRYAGESEERDLTWRHALAGVPVQTVYVAANTSFASMDCPSTGECGTTASCPCTGLSAALQQAALIASNGTIAEVVALPGVYSGAENVQLQLGSFPLVLRSLDPSGTVIDCGQESGPVFQFSHSPSLLGSGHPTFVDGINITNCKKSTNPSLGGAAILAIDGGDGTLSRMTITNCTADPVVIESSSKLRFLDSSFSDNDLSFGSLFSVYSNCTLSLTGSSLMFNNGGVFSGHSDATVHLTSCQVYNNTAGTTVPEPIAIERGRLFTALHCIFANNVGDVVAGAGGGLRVIAVRDVSIKNCTFLDNKAAVGGGLYLDCTSSDACETDDLLFLRNEAILGGGGMTLLSFSFTQDFSNMTFVANTAAFGAGMFGVGEFAARHITATGNIAAVSGGGYFSLSGSQVLSRSTLDDNISIFAGGGMSVWGTSQVDSSGCVFKHNTAVLSPGGGVSVSNFGKLHMDTGTFEDNMSSTAGGGIACDLEGVVSVRNVFFRRNNATSVGGAASFQGPAKSTISDSEFIDNRSLQGGAMYLGSSSATEVTYTTFQRNVANSYGGAVYFDENSLARMENCTIVSNDALTGGGGIFSTDEANPTIVGCILSRNAASNGGGLLVGDQSKAVVDGCTIQENTASSSGGGMAVRSFGNPTIRNCEFSLNRADSLGGAIALMDQSNTAVEHCLVIENTSPTNGGGLYSGDNSSGTVENTLFIRNKASSNGGAGYMSITSSVAFVDVTFVDNTAGTNGGALSLANNCTSTFTSCEFHENVAISGGAVDLHDHCTPAFFNCAFDNNTSSSNGGAVFSSSSAVAVFSFCNFTRNSIDSGNGGALSMIDFSVLFMHTCIVSDNSATTGGGLNIAENTEAHIIQSVFYNNTARLNGGAVIVSGSSEVVIHGMYGYSNRALGDGGALSLQDESSAVIDGSLLRFNDATQGGAVAIASESNVEINDCLLDSNTASFGGGAYIDTRGTFRSDNLTITNNEASSAGGLFISASKSYIERLAVRSNNATFGAGGGIVVQPPKQANTSFCDDCVFMDNKAKSGGGLYVLPTNAGGGSFGAFTNPGNFNMTSNFMLFTGALVEGNSATYGGGIWYTDGSTPGAVFVAPYFKGNRALEYGGGVYISTYLDSSNIAGWVQDGLFGENRATFAGSTAAWALPYPTNPSQFCANCTFLSSNQAGYQNSDGFATAPSAVSYTEAPPQNIYLEQKFNVSMVLVDAFETRVQGTVLAVNTYTAQAEDSTSICSLDLAVPNTTFSTEGSAKFENVLFEGKDGSSCSIGFDIVSSPVTSNIPGTDFVVTLSGCPSGEKVESGDEVDSCTEVILDPFVISVTIISVLICLLVIILVLVAAAAVATFYRRYQERQLMYREIPDCFAYRENVTLQTILNDPEINHINWDHIEQGERIGVGSSGIIFSGIWTPPGKEPVEVALKQLLFSVHELHDDMIIRDFLVEIKLTSALKHPNIVEFYGITFPESNELVLVMELMHRGSVRSLLDSKGDNLGMDLRLKLTTEAAQGMQYLHSRDVIHRDIKSTNFMVDKKWTCKVGDLGISTIRSDLIKRKTIVGTPVYMAPEVLRGEEYSFQVDVFSFGVFIIEAVTGYRPYTQYKKLQMLIEPQLVSLILTKGLRPSTAGVHPAITQLATDCWSADPALRPSFAEVVTRLQRFGRSDELLAAYDPENADVEGELCNLLAAHSDLLQSGDLEEIESGLFGTGSVVLDSSSAHGSVNYEAEGLLNGPDDFSKLV